MTQHLFYNLNLSDRGLHYFEFQRGSDPTSSEPNTVLVDLLPLEHIFPLRIPKYLSYLGKQTGSQKKWRRTHTPEEANSFR